LTAPRILFLISEDWYFCVHWLQLAKEVRNAGFEVTVATRVARHGDRIRAAGFDLVALGWSRRSTNPFREFFSVLEVARTFRKVRPDIVHQCAIKPVLYGALASLVVRIPIVVSTVAGLGYIFSSRDAAARMLRPLVRAAFHLLLDRPNAQVIVQNPDDRAQFLREGIVEDGSLFLIKGAGVDLEKFAQLPEPEGIPLVVLPARMLRDKGVCEFVEAARALKKRGVVARFALVGTPDPENPACIPDAQLAEWHAEGVVEYWGWREDIPAVLQQSNIVCLPSYREGLPTSLIEASACGRAIVTTDVPGCREVVTDGENGLLVAARDAFGLAAALQRLIEDAPLRRAMGRVGKARAEREFSIGRVVSETLALYEAAIERTGGRVPSIPSRTARIAQPDR
jgi:glycosyltransferase involved in cell wall biosynthesis